MITSQQWFDYAAALKAYEKEVRKYARKLKKYEETAVALDGGDPPKPPVKGFDTPPVPPTPIVP